MKKNLGNIPKMVNKSRLWLLTVCYCLFFSVLGGCGDDDSSAPQHNPNLPVTVAEVFPDSGRIIDPIIIHGNNFGTDKSKIKVFFGDKEAAILTAENEHLYVLNPKQKGGMHEVKVVVGDKEAVAPQQFKYLISASVYTVAGTGAYDVIDGNALEAAFGRPQYLAIDDQGNLIVVDRSDWVRLVSIEERKVKTIHTAADIYGCCFSPDYNTLYVGVEGKRRVGYSLQRNINWTLSSLINDGTLDYTCDLATIDNGDIITVSYYQLVGKVDKNTHALKVLGELNTDFAGDKAADFHMTYNPHDKMMYVSSTVTHVIFRFDPYKETLTNDDFELYAGIVGRAGYMDGNITEATFNLPGQMAFDEDGNMLVADRGNHVIRMITTEGGVSTFAGSVKGDADGKPEEAKFNAPEGITIAPDGLVYVGERDGRKIRCIAIQ